MKILIDARMYGPEFTGIGRYLINLIKELIRLDLSNEYVLILRRKYFNLLKVPQSWEKVHLDANHYSLKEQILLPKILKQINPNLVHFPHFNIPIFWKGKFVVTIHDMTMHRQGKNASTLPDHLYYLKRMLYKIIFKKAVLEAQKIIVPTYTVRKDISDYYDLNKDKFKVIYEGFDDAFSGPNHNKNILTKYKLGHKYFVYAGNVYPYKNLSQSVAAVKLINEKFSGNVSLVIICSRSIFLKRLYREVKNLKAEKYTKFLGFVPDEDLSILFKHSIAFVYPSLAEGFGIQGLEAMASGTLLLASDIPVFKEIYGNHAIYFNPYDPLSIAKAMKNAIKMNDDKRTKIVKNSRNFIKMYSWSKMAKQTHKVYKEVSSVVHENSNSIRPGK